MARRCCRQPDFGNPTVQDEREPQETWIKVDLGTRGAIERVPFGNFPPAVARAAILPDQVSKFADCAAYIDFKIDGDFTDTTIDVGAMTIWNARV